MHEYDVGIIGGGAAGSAAATMLARAGHSIAIIERSAYDDMRIGETLPPRARILLEKLGVYASFERTEPVESPGIVTAWGSKRPYANDFIVNPYGSGWHVDRAQFDRMLATHARKNGATVYENARVVACERQSDTWHIAIRSPAAPSGIRCRFVVDASGRRASALKRRAGRRTIYDRLVGIAAFVAQPADDLRTLIEADAGGWWYSSPVPGGQVCMYMTDADLVRSAERTDARSFLERKLEDAPLTRARIRGLSHQEPVTTNAAMTYEQPRLHGDDWLLIGDAASTWDPLSGQGICKAIESGINAAEAIEHALCGCAQALGEYAAWHRAGFREYLQTRTHYYRAEQRWPDSPFWRRRHAFN